MWSDKLFTERLRMIREKRGLSQAQLADAIGIKRPSYTTYEVGTSRPPLDKLFLIAQTLSVSTDFLLGLTDNNGKVEASSYGDFARLVVSFLNDINREAIVDGFVNFPPLDISEAELEKSNGCMMTIKVIRDPIIARFAYDLYHMNALLVEGIISREVFQEWYDKRVETLDGIPYLQTDEEFQKQYEWAKIRKKSGEEYSYNPNAPLPPA